VALAYVIKSPDPRRAPSQVAAAMPLQRARLMLFVFLVALAAVAGVATRRSLLAHPASRGVRGAELGMTPADVRQRFAPPTAGRWVASTGATRPGETELAWEVQGVGGEPSVRFEFHSAQLVAVRAVLAASDPDALGGALVVSPAAVVSRRGRSDGRVEVTLLARDCPIHAAEVRRLIASR